MDNLASKSLFLKEQYTIVLSEIRQETPPKWGKMNVQQMIEHMSDYVRIANGKTKSTN